MKPVCKSLLAFFFFFLSHKMRNKGYVPSVLRREKSTVVPVVDLRRKLSTGWG